MPAKSDREIDQTIAKNLPKLSKYGVLTVRPGYEIAGHQLTGKRAIVATVHTKRPLTDLPKGEALPDRIGGVPVDVREASPYQRLRAIDPLAAEVSQTYSRPEDAEPDWPLERELPSGALLSSARSETQTKLKAQRKAQPAGDRALLTHTKKPQLPYKPVGCPPLIPVSITSTLTAAISPDAALPTLTKFLSATTSSLKVGMYDFTSAEIKKAFVSDLPTPKQLQMVLDDPALNPTADESDWQTVQDLKDALGGRASTAWALTRSNRFAAKWLFPYAYHIKVIVRDLGTVFISSGNLNRSNEPDLQDPPSAEDRDWHVIIQDARLAETFAKYLDFDFQQASANQAANPTDIEHAIEEAQAKRKAVANPPPPPRAHAPKRAPNFPVAAKTFNNLTLTVTPLLTPDKIPSGEGQYLSNIMALIGSAQKSIYIQLQYIEASKGNGSLYDQLLEAIAKQVSARKDVRLIVSANYAEKWGEKMKATGVDLTENIRTQPDVHNKGFVVDSKTVVVSSQNFSPAGISDNRDAGVIMESSAIAQYFEPIFLADWNIALPFVAKGAAPRKRAATRIRNARKSSAKTGRKQPQRSRSRRGQ